MTLAVQCVTIDCAEPRALAEFWASALNWKIVYLEDDGAALESGSTGLAQLYLQRVPEPKSGKNRAHLDLSADDFDAEIARLQQLGATVLGSSQGPGGSPSAVCADLEGNEFCVTGAR